MRRRAGRGPLAVTIAPIPADDLLSHHLDEIGKIWSGTTRERVREILPGHARRDAFRFLAARTARGLLAGFAYGYAGAPGQWWHDLVADAMNDEQRKRWLAPGHFEFTELHVRSEFRRRGIGRRLHDELLVGAGGPTAVLSTQKDNTPALALYRERGWQLVLDEISFGAGYPPFCVLGIGLPYLASQ